jgi:UPF0271 protein
VQNLLPNVELNCDLGEREPPEQTATLMSLVDSVSIACGGHAGDETSMRRCLELALQHGVRAGAHPGSPGRREFGRGDEPAPAMDLLQTWLTRQIGDLRRLAEAAGLRLHHVKLHGSLYHATDRDPMLARGYVGIIARRWPELAVYARAGGVTIEEARRRGLQACDEAFLDRGYLDDGTLVERGQPGAVLQKTAELVVRLKDLGERGGWRSIHGRWLELRPRTLCVHGDTPRAIDFLRTARTMLGRG